MPAAMVTGPIMLLRRARRFFPSDDTQGPRRDSQAEYAWLARMNTKMVDWTNITYQSYGDQDYI